MEDAEVWLNDWEQLVHDSKISPNEFLTCSTAEGLRVTLRSSIELCRYLLYDCGFKYVLTGKMNQDPLEVPIFVSNYDFVTFIIIFFLFEF